MRNTTIAAWMVLYAAPALAQTPAAVCDTLKLDWRNLEMDLAENHAEGIVDNSAPRATLRAINESNILTKSTMTLQMMRDNRCPLPKRAPDYITYFLDAMKCQTEKMKSNYKAPECDHAKWTRAGTDRPASTE